MGALTVLPWQPPWQFRPPRTIDPFLPAAGLVLVAAIWGTSFTVVDSATAQIPPADLVAWRFGIGALLLTALGRSRAPLGRRLRTRGVVLGLLLGGGFLLQTWALTFIDALTSGFLTGLLVVIAPVAAWLMFGERCTPATWLSVGVASAGLLVLGFRETGFGPGEVLTLLAAAMWGAHVVLLSRWSTRDSTLSLARVQTATVAVMALVVVALAGLMSGRTPLPALPADTAGWWSIVFLAVLATAVAMVLLTWSQARVGSTRAAVILTLEPAIAGVVATALGVALTARTVIGAALLLGAMLAVTPDRRVAPKPTA